MREELAQRAGSDAHVVVDFDGVTNVSYSFADEFLGKLSADGSLRITTENARPGRIVRRAVARRAGTAAVC